MRLPEITEEDENSMHGSESAPDRVDVQNTYTTGEDKLSHKPLWQNRHFRLGVVAQGCYVAAQTGVFSYLINFVTDHDMHPRFDLKYAPYFLSFGFLLFMIGRITGSILMKYFKPQRLLGLYAFLN